jgi:hypothetical protein
MDVSNKIPWLAAGVLIAGIALHQVCIRRESSRTRPDRPSAPPPETPVAIRADAIAMDRAVPDARPSGEGGDILPPDDSPVVVVDPGDSPSVRRRLVDQQVWQMEKYAREAGPDDPFALSSEEIEEFRQRGDPYLW